MWKINTKFTVLFLILISAQTIFTMQREIEQSGNEQILEYADSNIPNLSNEIPQVQVQSKIKIYDIHELTDRLFNAACDGRVEDLRELLQDPRVDVNAKNRNGKTVLHLAAREGDVESVRVLLQDPRIEVNARDNDGYTVLIQSACYSAVEVIRELLKDQRVEVNASNNNGNTALHLATWNGHIENVRELLKDPRTEVNVRNKDGDTALHLVACNGYQVKIARELLQDPRIDVNAKNKDGDTALDFADRARSLGHPGVFELMKKDSKESSGYISNIKKTISKFFVNLK